jgi:hypothetical protein
LVATEKKRDETHQHITSPCAGKVLNELKAECNALAKDLYSCYEKIRRDPWLSQLAPVQRIVETLIERLAKDYEEILAQELQQ